MLGDLSTMSLRSLLLSLAGLCAVLVVAPLSERVAHAQTTGVMIALSTAATAGTTPSLARTDATHNCNPTCVQKRSLSLNPEGVNLQDCRDNQSILFPLTITGGGNFIGEVWATDTGAKCSDAAQRNTATAQCYKIASSRFIITPTQTVTVNVKEMIKGLGDQSASTDSFGCRQTNLTTIDVWFLALSGSNSQGELDVPIKVSTLGPQALTGVRAQPGDTRVTVSWDLVGEGGSVDVIGATAYCDANPTPVGASDASAEATCTTPEASTDGDADASETPEPTCTGGTTSTAAGAAIPQPPNIDSNGAACTTAAFSSTTTSGKSFYPDKAFSDKYQCGSVTGTGATGSSIVIGSASDGTLVNGKTYAVAVAAVDSFGNIGALSSPICQFPEETSDFWRDYRNSGGQSGGGFCSVEGPGVPVGSFALMMVGVVVGLSSMRRVRRHQRRRNPR
jgi:hypothetical protein